MTVSSVRTQLDGINQLLGEMYRGPIRVGELLRRLGFDADQRNRVRSSYLDVFTALFSAVLQELTAAWADNRTYPILSQRYGLDGLPPLTLAELGEQFGISRERVRQLEVRALRRLRAVKSRGFIEERLRLGVAGLVGLPRDTATTATPITVAAPMDKQRALTPGRSRPVKAERAMLGTEQWPLVAESAHEVLQALGSALSLNLLAHVLVGSKGPVVSALVDRYRVRHYGRFQSFKHGSVKEVLRRVCAGDERFQLYENSVRLRAAERINLRPPSSSS